jgi:hypothetical protein
MTADRMDNPSFELTQHFLAQMLAVRRTSVSEVAQSLAEDGCITYQRSWLPLSGRSHRRGQRSAMATSERVTWETSGRGLRPRAPTFCNFPPAGARRPTGADAQA